MDVTHRLLVASAVAAVTACGSGQILFPTAAHLSGMWSAWEFTVTDSTGTRLRRRGQPIHGRA
jgi:hypothetical protein